MRYDEDDDPILENFRVLDYRYIRFAFHPLKDKFLLTNSWKDPAWVDVKSIRAGIDGDEKENRDLIFGPNAIDIKQKSIPQLLMDEVGFRQVLCLTAPFLTKLGIPSFLRLPDCKLNTMVC